MLSSLQPQQIVVTVLNALLRREEWALEKVQRHAGKHLRLKVGQFQTMWAILPTGQIAWVRENISPNVTLTMDDNALRRLPAAICDSTDMDEWVSLWHIEGEAGLARLVSELAHHLRWDIGAELTALFGPFAANMMMNAAKKAVSVGKVVHEKGLEKTKNFLRQDYHVIVQTPVVDELKHDIQDLQRSIVQLEQRIQTLRKA